MEYFTRADVAAMLAPPGRALHPSTILRWVRDGLAIGSRRVKLPATQLPSRVVHSERDVRRFLKRLEGAYVHIGLPTKVITFEEAVRRLPGRSPRAARQRVNSVSMVQAAG